MRASCCQLVTMTQKLPSATKPDGKLQTRTCTLHYLQTMYISPTEAQPCCFHTAGCTTLLRPLDVLTLARRAVFCTACGCTQHVPVALLHEICSWLHMQQHQGHIIAAALRMRQLQHRLCGRLQDMHMPGDCSCPDARLSSQ